MNRKTRDKRLFACFSRIKQGDGRVSMATPINHKYSGIVWNGEHISRLDLFKCFQQIMFDEDPVHKLTIASHIGN